MSGRKRYTDVRSGEAKPPFPSHATARPPAGERDVNNLHARRPNFSQTDNDDVTTPKDLQGKVGGQPRSIPELQKDITAQIEDDFMQRMSIAMEHAFGHFLNSSKGSIISMMGESQGCVIKLNEAGSHADANKANNDYVSSMAAAANQPGDLVPALTTALTAALVTLQKTAPDPVPRGSCIKLMPSLSC